MRHDNQDPEDADPGKRLPDGGGPDDDGAALEAEIRRGRTFSLAEAVGRAAAGSLKGASPVPASRQALLAAEALLEAKLNDPEGSLAGTLLARLADDLPLLDRHRDHPADALAELLDRVLATPAALADFVRETDARWGRDYDERPRFESPGRPAAPDDPYPVDDVRARLVALRGIL
jgi:hypothetical protein